MKYKTLWHITPAFNVDSILSKGIDPAYDTKERGEVWLVKWSSIAWALAHVSFKKRIPVWQLVCIRVKVPAYLCTHFNRGIWKTRVLCKSTQIYSAERTLSRWEHQREGMAYARKR